MNRDQRIFAQVIIALAFLAIELAVAALLNIGQWVYLVIMGGGSIITLIGLTKLNPRKADQ